MMNVFLGLDISTTAAKALIINEQGTVIASCRSPLQLSQPHPLWSEQWPDDWWRGMVRSIRAVLAKNKDFKVSAIGLTGQMHGLVILDIEDQVIRPAILWNDQRTGEQCKLIRDRVGMDLLVSLTGNDALPGFTAPKILWVREHEPASFSRISHILLPKDFIRYRLTGKYATDLAGASGTLLLDVANRRWSTEIMDLLEIPKAWLPPTHEGVEQTGSVTSEASSITGLLQGTPVFAGGGDQAAQAVGVGAVSPGIVALTLGTSGVIFAPMSEYVYEPEGRLHAFCHAIPNQWHLMSVMLSAAGSLQWYRDNLAPDMTYDNLISEAGNIPQGAEGLVFLPYLTGERSPYPDPLARGAFVGLTSRHTRGHMTRAVLEGVCFGLKDCLELLCDAGVRPQAIRVSGGGTRNPLWRQLIADILNIKIETVSSEEGAAFGASILSAVGFGAFSNVVEACNKLIVRTGGTLPSNQSNNYAKFYPRYKALYPKLAGEFAALSAYSRNGTS
jgi:xylulokinase